MLNLAIAGIDRSLQDAAGARLRGVALTEPGQDTSDALLLLGEASPDRRFIESVAKRGGCLFVGSDWNIDQHILDHWTASGGAPPRYCFLPRQLAAVRLIRQQLQSGHLGKPGLIRTHRWLSRSETVTEAAKKFRVLTEELDLALWFAAAAPERVFALERSDSGGPTVLQVHLGFPHGAMAVLDLSIDIPTTSDYRAISLIGSNGAASADDHANLQWLMQPSSSAAILDNASLPAVVSLLAEIRDNFASVEWAEQSRRDRNAATQASELVQASLRTGNAIAWSDV